MPKTTTKSQHIKKYAKKQSSVKKVSSSSIEIGILGGGQLARMLALAAHNMGVIVHVLSPRADDPAAQVCQFWQKGDPNKVSDLTSFFQRVKNITFESEFQNAASIQQALQNIPPKQTPKFFPELRLMDQISDRRIQKKMLVDANIPTSPFLFSCLPQEHLQFFKTHQKVVYKKRRFGYDGYGTYVIKTLAQLMLFLKQNKLEDFIVEAFIPFEKEMAISFFRNRSGVCVQFPLVQTSQVENRCDWVSGPHLHPSTDQLSKKIKSWMNQTNYVGGIAFELFKNGNDFLVNEIAPRVHNSAHYSIDVCSVSQFELHLLCGIAKELPAPILKSEIFCMLNLLGTNPNCLKNIPFSTGKVHWYGKKEAKPGRKMGHLNFVPPQSEKKPTNPSVALSNFLEKAISSLLKKALAERKKYFPNEL